MEGTIIAQETMAETVAPVTTATNPDEPTEDEQQLAGEIRKLWAAHQDGQAAFKRTKAEIKAVRERLSEHLWRMKQILVKPGRNGNWSAFLRSEGIAKATADRVVRQRHKSEEEQTNIPTEEVSQSAPPNVERLLRSLLPRLKSNLTTSESAYEFVVRFADAFGLDCNQTDGGMLVFDPLQKELSDPAVESAAAEQPSADVGGANPA